MRRTASFRAAEQVLVVLQLSTEGLDALHWAVQKCHRGDGLVALYIVDTLPGAEGPRPVREVSDDELEMHKQKMAVSCFTLFADVQEACDAKQIALTIRVAHGEDERPVILHEAAEANTTKLVIAGYEPGMADLCRYLSLNLDAVTLYGIKAGRQVFSKGIKARHPGSTSLNRNSFRTPPTFSPEETSPGAHASALFSGGSPDSSSHFPRENSTGETNHNAVPHPPPGHRAPPRAVQLTSSHPTTRPVVRSSTFSEANSPVQHRLSISGPMPGLSRSSTGEVAMYTGSYRAGGGGGSGAFSAVRHPSPLPSGKEQVPRTLRSVSFKGLFRVSSADSAVNRVGRARPRSREEEEEWQRWEQAGADGGENHAAPRVMEVPGQLNRLWREYSLREMEEATSFFSEKSMLGMGGFSKVYRGILPDGEEIAVKRMANRVEDEADKGAASRNLRTLEQEVAMMATVRHTNVVALRGFCLEDGENILVYELMERGTLADALYADDGAESALLSWDARFELALEAARGMEYLHCYCPQFPIIHRDIKASNILINKHGTAKVADFGLAKFNQAGETATEVEGTFGYLAPEYYMFGKVDEKSDVYAFGVVLLELLTGCLPVDNTRPKGQENLILWAKPSLEGENYHSILDERLSDDPDAGDPKLQRMAKTASMCLHHDPNMRPDMGQVLRLLEGPVENYLPSNLEPMTPASHRRQLGLVTFASISRRQFAKLLSEDDEEEEKGESGGNQTGGVVVDPPALLAQDPLRRLGEGSGPRQSSGGSGPRQSPRGSSPRQPSGGSGPRQSAGGSGPRQSLGGSGPRQSSGGSGPRTGGGSQELREARGGSRGVGDNNRGGDNEALALAESIEAFEAQLRYKEHASAARLRHGSSSTQRRSAEASSQNSSGTFAAATPAEVAAAAVAAVAARKAAAAEAARAAATAGAAAVTSTAAAESSAVAAVALGETPNLSREEPPRLSSAGASLELSDCTTSQEVALEPTAADKGEGPWTPHLPLEHHHSWSSQGSLSPQRLPREPSEKLPHQRRSSLGGDEERGEGSGTHETAFWRTDRNDASSPATSPPIDANQGTRDGELPDVGPAFAQNGRPAQGQGHVQAQAADRDIDGKDPAVASHGADRCQQDIGQAPFVGRALSSDARHEKISLSGGSMMDEKEGGGQMVRMPEGDADVDLGRVPESANGGERWHEGASADLSENVESCPSPPPCSPAEALQSKSSMSSPLAGLWSTMG
eukprot:TRINITY_DN778_c0_g4_i1.p1 TRINITY_DN778_c0_g4~~TRINITY_DN778_c0_g4_i1.p1  ORF type:complete len:1235 (+),score=239.25 TRINITY_DN778_c0_g4_i1:795-4499(+)